MPEQPVSFNKWLVYFPLEESREDKFAQVQSWPESTSTGSGGPFVCLGSPWPLQLLTQPLSWLHNVTPSADLFFPLRSISSLPLSGFLDPDMCFSRFFLLWVIFVLVCFVFMIRCLCKPAEGANLFYCYCNHYLKSCESYAMQICSYPIVKKFRKVFITAFSLHFQRTLVATMH